MVGWGGLEAAIAESPEQSIEAVLLGKEQIDGFVAIQIRCHDARAKGPAERVHALASLAHVREEQAVHEVHPGVR